jgi:hypothetical protein
VSLDGFAPVELCRIELDVALCLRVRETWQMLRGDPYEEVRRDAEHARIDAQQALDAARRRGEEIAARLSRLRSSSRAAASPGDRGDLDTRDAFAIAATWRDQERRGYERAARAHDRAVRQHDSAAALYDGQADSAGAGRERSAGVRERQAAEQDRRAAARIS